MTERADHFRSWFELPLIGLAVSSPTKGWLAVNDYLCAMLEYPREDLARMTWAEITHPDDVAKNVEQFERVLRGEIDGYSLEKRFITKSGATLFTELGVRCVRHADGTGDHFVAVIKDITERKRLEEEREASLRKLQESEARLRLLANNALDVIWTMSLDGRFTYVSPSIEKLRGYTAEEVMTHGLDEALTPESAKVALEALASALGNLDSTGEEPAFRGELEQPRKDGTTVWTEVSTSALRDESGQIVGIVGVSRDISERKKSEAERAKLEAQLHHAQKMDSVGRLAGGVAHDFNNMLGVILGHVELALEEVEPGTRLHADLVEIGRAGRRSAELTRQLLAFARKQTITPRVLALADTVSAMTSMLQRLIGEHIRLVWRPTPGLWPVLADPSQIDQILANLCVNSRDAITDRGTITITAENTSFDEAHCARHPEYLPGDFVRLSVTDDGSGMDAETMAHLFEPFFTTKALGQGTGLGLATVYGAVKQNRGFVTVTSRLGAGTTVSIHLPRHGATRAPTSDLELPRPAAGRETLLVVEDEPSILAIMRRMLERQGYSVLAAGSASEALRIGTEHTGPIALLVTDVVMPEMNGRDLADVLRARRPELLVLFVSGYTADVITPQGVTDGTHFLEKPFSMDRLARKVREVLGTPPSA
ncbi:PAS domain S-box protein [Myxococcota bacterium]|nr:PAS domain S-box protein [Myxococcota bacterium]